MLTLTLTARTQAIVIEGPPPARTRVRVARAELPVDHFDFLDLVAYGIPGTILRGQRRRTMRLDLPPGYRVRSSDQPERGPGQGREGGRGC